MVVDNMTDKELFVLHSLFEEDGDFSFLLTVERNGAMKNIYRAIRSSGASPDDVIAIVDIDDQLRPNALRKIEEVYRDPNVMLTYGSYVTESTGKLGRHNGEIKGNVREERWTTSHLRTFRKKLFDAIPIDDFMMGGNWVMTAGDLAIMLPAIELAGIDRTRYIKERLYIYNNRNPNNDHKVNALDQIITSQYIRNKTPLKRIEVL
jgi:hypothetical protein